MSNSKRKSLHKSSETSSSSTTTEQQQQQPCRKKPTLLQERMRRQINERKLNILSQIKRNPQPTVPRLINGLSIKELSSPKSLFMKVFEAEPSFEKYKWTVDFAFKNEKTERENDFLGRGKQKILRSKSKFADIFRNSEISKESPRPPDPHLPTYEFIKQRQGQWDQKFAQPSFKTRQWRNCLEPDRMKLVQHTLKDRFAKAELPGAMCEAPDFEKLRPGTWVNDNVVNYYGVMINIRSTEFEKNNPVDNNNDSFTNSIITSSSSSSSSSEFLRSYCFTTFFIPKYKKTGFDGVKRWSKKVDLFKKDIIIFPVNIQNTHWVCAAINLRQRRFEYYDSMGNTDVSVIDCLKDYIEHEHLAKRKTELDTSDWEICHPKTPQQNNGYDCGIFVCQFMESLSRNWGGGDTFFDFNQGNVPYIRSKVTYEIATCEFLEEEWS